VLNISVITRAVFRLYENRIGDEILGFRIGEVVLSILVDFFPRHCKFGAGISRQLGCIIFDG
jgi:hypothetical protein